MIAVRNLIKRYGDYTLSVDLDIPAGTVTGLVGKNGAGKSTTIKAILGLIKPDEGSVSLFGKDVAALTRDDRRLIGTALSDAGFSQYLNIDDVAAVMKAMYTTFDRERFLEVCRTQGLPEKKTIKEFSTGMKAKLRVLLALSHKAKLLILDEPTAGLDVQARCDVLDIIRRYLADNEECSILITSHIASDLENICDDIYLIHEGRVILHEDNDVILSNYAVIKVPDEMYNKIDKTYLIKTKKETFGYTCLTNEKQFYLDNYPQLIIENGGIDDLILMMTGGK